MSEPSIETSVELNATPQPPQMGEEERQRPHSLVSLVLLVFLGAIGYNLYFVCQQKQFEVEDKQAELQVVRQEMYASEIRNRRLAARVKHLKTNAGVEEVAREKLGLVSPGEMAFVVIPGAPEETDTEADSVPTLAETRPDLLQRLLHQLFCKDRQPRLPSRP